MQFVRQNKDHAICTDSRMTFASRGLRVKLATANLSGTGHGEQRGQRTGQEVRMSGKQQKGEAISRAARAETGAHRRQVQLVCLDQLPSRHEHQREESARCCHFCRVAAARRQRHAFTMLLDDLRMHSCGRHPEMRKLDVI